MTIIERARKLRMYIEKAAEHLDDADALESIELFPAWQTGETYDAGQRLRRGGRLYKVIQPVTALASQPPEAEGMLAIYRPVEVQHGGTAADPIPYLAGMDVQNGLYYSYNELIYLAKADMPACVWPPDSGIWQWEIIVDNS